ncbi:probable LRR receptor-like serine/threonine-protein kinase At1g67720 isoform X2 [Telopea speciosissima]|uniref:probable LRR receptor-like serine/threonine-protein kinase At1g67720 isoform X2 n=1 Tax=Telopea speciosissima TaxID=54955 RepID=UPI001CC6DB66|nr:probable LRR receptor-like serine/threonine-protein kinase At1g67720 isoform X2 [Telopea speciosissima]
MALSLYFLVLFLHLIPSVICQVKEFVSIDCGGTSNYTDPSTGLAWVSDTGFIRHGKAVDIKNPNGDSPQYQRRRDFPADRNKYCYTLSTTERRRYLVRATFQYGNSVSGDPYPKFQLYLDATMWSTITVLDASRVYVEEMIIRATSTAIDVCLCCATTGSPFISTLELRPLNLSLYATDYEDSFYLAVGVRVNFGALSKDPIRYPDDPYDRIWESDLDKRQNFLVGVAPGTESISTSKNIKITREFPPIKVMQTAVVGTQGRLSYRLTLEGFPANARAYAYFAEIEDLGTNETRKFIMQQPLVPGYNNVIVNIAENANGSYTLYEPSYMNVSLDFVLSFSFVKTRDSTRGPLLNAIEISKYVQIIPKTQSNDVMTLDAFHSMPPGSDWIHEEGDPCIPTQWEWITCSSSTPPRITKLALSEKYLTGKIPDKLKHLDGLTELWLDGNSLTGSIPDISNLLNLTIVHLENNRLTGPIPSYLGDLPSLRELYVQNNSLSGEIPSTLLTGNLVFNYDGNPELIQGVQHKKNFKLIVGTSVGVFVVFVVFILGSLLLLCNLWNMPAQEKSNSLHTISKPSTSYSLVHGGSLMVEGPDVAYYITLPDLEEATHNFSRKIGKGSFGPVYYGKMKDGKEVAVKILADASSHGNQQFINEVALLSRIHHRNLVPLVGYCEEAHQHILVYEYMHNGSLQDYIHDSVDQKHLDWLSRLSIAEDAAKGLEYLHTGCNPSIIHRDVKTSNILLDINMRAKVSDFGLSRQADDNLTHVSSVACGTVGYLDPEYYANQQLTEKSDVYSFGVVLLELISGRKPVSVEEYGAEWHIIHWARSLIRKGDVMSILDPSLAGDIKIESLWRIAEVAILSVEPHGGCRPKMQDIVLAIQDAIKIEMERQRNYTRCSRSRTRQSPHISLPSNSLETDISNFSGGCTVPSAR